MICTKKRKINEPNLHLYNEKMEKVKEFKYLGMWLDEKCTWKAHVEKIETKCKKVINLMRANTGNTWGADKQALIDIYRALMRSAIDYGCMIYGAAARTHLNKMQNRALRISLGATKTTPTKAMMVEAGEIPLELRRDKLALSYWIRLRGCGDENTTKSVLNECWEYGKFKGNGYGWYIKEKTKQYKMTEIIFNPPTPISSVPPWLFPKIQINTEIMELKEGWGDTRMNDCVNQYLKKQYYNSLQVYTDGSKDQNDHVGTGVYIPQFNIKIGKRITDQLSVYTAEMMAVIIALQWVEEVRPDSVVVCTDSVSALLSLQYMKSSREDLMLEIYQCIYRLHRIGIAIGFCWVPAHVGIEGNETADRMAKKALNMKQITDITFGKGEGKAIIKKNITELWQNMWDTENKGRTYYRIQKSINVKSVIGKNRREIVALTRLRFDHTNLNKTLFLMGNVNTPTCEHCHKK